MTTWGSAAERHDQDDAEHRHRRAGRQEEEGLQDGVVGQGETRAGTPLRPVADTLTSAETSARPISGLGTGTASTGPTRSVRYNPLAIARPRGYTRSQRDLDRPANLRGQLVGIRRAVGVADHPVEDRIAEELGRQVVQPVAVDDRVGLGRGIDVGLGDDPPLQVSTCTPSAGCSTRSRSRSSGCWDSSARRCPRPTVTRVGVQCPRVRRLLSLTARPGLPSPTDTPCTAPPAGSGSPRR